MVSRLEKKKQLETRVFSVAIFLMAFWIVVAEASRWPCPGRSLYGTRSDLPIEPEVSSWSLVRLLAGGTDSSRVS